MDIALLILGLISILTGIVGAVLPVLPGTPLAWFGLVLLYATNAVPANYGVLVVSLVVTVVIVILDYVLPAQGTKRFGGSKYGIWGTNIGLIVGIFAPIPFGFLIGPFVGAFIGELIYNTKISNLGAREKHQTQRAFKAASGAFFGFLVSSFMKLMVCLIFLGLFIAVAWQYRANF